MATPSSFKDKLETLILSNNKKITLSNDMSSLVTLTTLDVKNCKLKSVPAVVMTLPKLETLILSDNSNITLPDEMSSPVPPGTLPEEIDQLNKIKRLDLSHCKLHTLPSEVGRLTQLEWLDLSSNPLQALPAEVGQLTNVKHLDLSLCWLRTLPPEVGGLTRLEWLDLSFNPLQTIPAEVGQLTNVKHLDLSYCRLRTLPPEVGRMTQLEWLNLSSNPLQTLTAEVGQLTNVKHLDLSLCWLRTLPPEVWRLTQLEWLDLSFNPLQTLPAEVGQLTNVKHLDLYNCQLHTLPPEVWRLTQLEWLDLRINPLQTLPAEAGQLTNVKHLDLSFCQLRTLPPEVWGLIQLERLYLLSNPLQTLPAEVGQLINVKHLDLSDCKQHTLPPEVWRLTQLEWLNLRSNPQQTIPAEVGQLTNVKHLDLSHCQLRTLPPVVWGMSQLEWLDLRDNQLQILPAEVGQLSCVIDLNVDGNPLMKPPVEVCCQGIAAIRQYFSELERSDQNVSARLKVVVLGEKMAGKTSLVQTLHRGMPTRTQYDNRTHFVEITQWKPDYNLTFEVYDFGGHEVYHLTHQFFLTPEALYLLLVNLQTYSCSEQSYTKAVGFWLETLNARVPGAVVSLVGSKMDLCQPDEVEGKTHDIQERIKLQEDAWQRHFILRKEKEEKHLINNRLSFENMQLPRSHLKHPLKQGIHITDDFICVSVKPKDFDSRNSLASFPAELKKFLLETVKDKTLFPTLKSVLPRTWVEFEDRLRTTVFAPDGGDSCDETSSVSSDSSIELSNVRNSSDQKGPTDGARAKSLQNKLKTTAPEWLTFADCARLGQFAGLSPDRLEPVLSYLQQVGTILRYTDIPQLKDLIFHDPPALIEIFKNLFHHSTAELFATPGIQNAYYTGEQLNNFELDLYKRGLIQKEVMTCLLPPNINPEIVTALMQRFGLCFEIQVEGETDPSKHTCWYRIPWYLQNQMPGELKSVWSEDVPETQEQLQLMCDIRGFCPRGLFQRFSVGIHPLVKDRTDWKDGAMAYRHDYPVLVCSKPVADDAYITMATRGRPDQADEMWGVVHPLLEVLVQLLQEWPGVLYSLHVTCAHCIKAGLDNPHQYDLRDRTADDGRHVRCPGVDFAASTSADLVYRPSRFSASSQRLKRSHDQAASGNRPKRSKCGKDEVAEMSGANSHQHRKRSQEQNTSGNRPKRFNGGKDKDAGASGEPKQTQHAKGSKIPKTTASSKRLKRPQNQKVSANPPKKFKRGKDEVARTSGDEFVLLKWLLTEVRVKDDAFEDNYSRLASHVSELGLTFRAEVPGDGNCMFHAVSDQILHTEGRHITHLQLREQAVGHLRRNPRNARGDHLSDFISNQTWEEYLETMSRDGTWGDHVVLQAMADMLARDVIIVSSVEADNYVTILHPQSGFPPRAARPLLLGHYAENHYASLDEKPSEGKPVVLLIIDEFGTSKGGISTINGQLMDILTHDDEGHPTSARAKKDQTRYPNLPSDINVIVGHADVTSTAARNIKKDRLPSAKFILYNHVMPEDTEHHKSDDRVMSIGDKMEAIREDTEEADVVFSVGPTMHDYYKTQIRLSKPHHLFLPKPSDIFSRMNVTYVEAETKTVLTVGRVRGVQKLKGYDLLVKAMGKVLDRFPKARLRIRGVSAEDFPESKEIIQANIAKGTFHFTPLKYGTQYQLSGDFREAHLVLMPSRAEPFGLVGLEAIAAGVPVLVSSNSGLAEFLRSRGPEFERLIIDIEGTDDVVAKRLAKRIIKVLKGGPAEFEAAKRLKDKLLASKYWEESHKKFLEECGIPQ
ncbi:malignant fibrous histiocytoma-amplified sequence 1 homolog [Branchiostoma lanceolatum]|uniref:malignant fibrous histiocytoma-amplified sequence 1 homolog n=1 Tax=Branchiostoma lanceolatum TaxID=7740 RepID=UPI003455A682